MQFDSTVVRLREGNALCETMDEMMVVFASPKMPVSRYLEGSTQNGLASSPAAAHLASSNNFVKGPFIQKLQEPSVREIISLFAS